MLKKIILLKKVKKAIIIVLMIKTKNLLQLKVYPNKKKNKKIIEFTMMKKLTKYFNWKDLKIQRNLRQQQNKIVKQDKQQRKILFPKMF